MKLKTKLTYGIGILFAMIVALGLLSVKYISNLSADTRNILADNYKSLDYAKKMLYALENIQADTTNRQIFIEIWPLSIGKVRWRLILPIGL